MSKVTKVWLRRLRLPLVQPYRLSYRTFEEFEPFLVEIEDDEGRRGFSDGHISPGSSSETREGGWAFAIETIKSSLGRDTEDLKARALARFAESKVAATLLVTAVEVLEGHPDLDVPKTTKLPLLTPINALEPAGIAKEIEEWLGMGFRDLQGEGRQGRDGGPRTRCGHPARSGRSGDAAARRQPGLFEGRR